MNCIISLENLGDFRVVSCDFIKKNTAISLLLFFDLVCLVIFLKSSYGFIYMMLIHEIRTADYNECV